MLAYILEYRHTAYCTMCTLGNKYVVSRPTCISGNGSQEFSPLWQQFEKDTADKKTIIIYKCILCQCLQNDVDDKLMILLMTFVMVVTIKMMTIIIMVDNRNNDERSLHQKTNCV